MFENGKEKENEEMARCQSIRKIECAKVKTLTFSWLGDDS